MHLLVMRFSAIGDVALTVPVLKSLVRQYPGLRITVLSRTPFRSLFDPLPVNFIAADLNGKHKGLAGLKKLHSELQSSTAPDKVIDLHGVLRTHVLSSLFKLSGTPVYKIDKGRTGKRKLTRKNNKVLEPLPHTTARYCKVFEEAGFPVDFDQSKPDLPQYESDKADRLWKELKLSGKAVGFAPLASFPGKSWPMRKVNELLGRLVDGQISVLLFGGPEDHSTLEKLKDQRAEVINLAGKLKFGEEIALMRHLHLMISMDSANMHLATLAGIPVVSIWGATHPFAGFGPLGKNDQLIAAIPPEELSCRPCSVFGNKPCFRHDYACLNWLTADKVMEKIDQALKLNK